MDCRISIEEKGEVGRSISIEIPRTVLNEQYERELSRAASSSRIKGFRPGRAPKAIVAKLYGGQIHGEVLKRLISDAYREAVENNSLDVVGYPDISIDNQDDSEKDLIVRAEVSVYPKPAVQNYEGLSFTVEVEEADDARVEQRIEALCDQHSSLEPVVDRDTAEAGDTAVIDYQGTIDGEPFEGGAGDDAHAEIGSGRLLPEIDEGLRGMRIGEEKQVKVTLPEGAKDLAGKVADYRLVLKALQKRIVPPLDDEFAKTTGLAEDMPGLRAALRSQVEKEVKRNNRVAKEEQLFQVLVERNPFEVPQPLIDEEIRAVLFEMRLLDPRNEDSYRIDISRFRDALGKPAEFRVRRAILLSRIIEHENMSFNEQDVDNWLNEIAEEEGVSREEVNKIYGFPKQTKRLQDMMASRKMIARLLEASQITERPKASGEQQA